MDTIVNDSPNLTPETVPVENVSVGLDSIAAKMAAMRSAQPRNQEAGTKTAELVAKIRARKGLKEGIPALDNYLDKL